MQLRADASTGRADLAAQLLEAQREVLAVDGDTRAFTAEVGEAATRAAKAYVAGD